MTGLQKKLFSMCDEKFGDFQSKLLPNIERECVIGVRTPVLKAFAKEYFKSGEYREFLNELPHKYFEENNLHAFLIEQIKDFESAVAEINKFLPYVDNWATCDQMSPKALKKNLPELEKLCFSWIGSPYTYAVRYGINTLMRYFLTDSFDEKYPKAISEIHSDEYYINMMIAWYFATALSKQKEVILPYFENKRLPKWVHNKAIRKAVESYRIDEETKAYLRTLKI